MRGGQGGAEFAKTFWHELVETVQINAPNVPRHVAEMSHDTIEQIAVVLARAYGPPTVETVEIVIATLLK